MSATRKPTCTVREATVLLDLPAFDVCGLLDHESIASHWVGRQRRVDLASLGAFLRGGAQ